MHILMIAISNYNFDPRIIRMSTALIDKKYAVDLICIRDDKQPKYEVVNSVHVHRIMKNFRKDSIFHYFFFTFLFLIKSMYKSNMISFKHKVDVLHVHNMPDYLVFAGILHKMRRIPIILDIHDLTIELFKEKWSKKQHNILIQLLLITEKISCCFADKIITVTNECVHILIDRGISKKKINLIMNSADENIFKYNDDRFLKKKTDKFKILYHGTIAERFGLHNFIKAMPEIIDVIPHVEFIIIGYINDTRYAEELSKMIANLGVAKHVFLEKPISYYELSRIIKKFDLGAVTYEKTHYMNLALPTKICEYALTGLPFIVSDLVSVRSVFSDQSVCYIDPKNSKSIAESVIELYRNPDKRINLSKKAFIDVNKISWNVMKKRYMNLIHGITDLE